MAAEARFDAVNDSSEDDDEASTGSDGETQESESDSQDNSTKDMNLTGQSENLDDRDGIQKKKKKKKKKKKTKKSNDEHAWWPSTPAEDQMLPVEEAEARYSAALEALRTNDEMCMWVQLSKCRLGDKKARKLIDAMKGNHTVTSIDLSDNSITDDGIQALVNVLADGAAPDLIALNIRRNQLTDKGQVLLSELPSIRKLVKVDFDDPNAFVDTTEVFDVDWNEGMPKNRWQINMNSWDPSGGEAIGRDRAEELPPQQSVDAALRLIQDSSTEVVPGLLAARLLTIVALVERELRDHSPRVIHNASIEKLPKGLGLVVRNIHRFSSVLNIASAPSICQRKIAIPSAGRHRVAAVELMHRLALAGCPNIDKAVLATPTVVTIVAMLVDFPWNSCLHSAVTRFVEVAIARPNSSICSSLLEGEGGLLNLLAKAGSEAAGMPVCHRLGFVGHVIGISKLLQESGKRNRALQAKLDRSKAWVVYTGDSGPLEELKKEQTGCLGGGPKPIAPQANGSAPDLDQGAAMLKELSALYLSHKDTAARK